MSQLRISRPGYPTVLIPMDDGASPGYRSKLGIKGGYGNPIVYGALAIGKSGVPHSKDRRGSHAAKPKDAA